MLDDIQRYYTWDGRRQRSRSPPLPHPSLPYRGFERPLFVCFFAAVVDGFFAGVLFTAELFADFAFFAFAVLAFAAPLRPFPLEWALLVLTLLVLATL